MEPGRRPCSGSTVSDRCPGNRSPRARNRSRARTRGQCDDFRARVTLQYQPTEPSVLSPITARDLPAGHGRPAQPPRATTTTDTSATASTLAAGRSTTTRGHVHVRPSAQGTPGPRTRLRHKAANRDRRNHAFAQARRLARSDQKQKAALGVHRHNPAVAGTDRRERIWAKAIVWMGATGRVLAWQCDHADHRRRTSARRRERSPRPGCRGDRICDGAIVRQRRAWLPLLGECTSGERGAGRPVGAAARTRRRKRDERGDQSKSRSCAAGCALRREPSAARTRAPARGRKEAWAHTLEGPPTRSGRLGGS